jgi:hypothetical protein
VKARPIQNHKVSPTVTNQVLLLQLAGGFAYALASHAQHVGQEFLRDLELVSSHPVAGHQQPASQSSVYRMEPVTDGALGDLRQPRVRVTSKQSREGTAIFARISEGGGFHSHRLASALHDRAIA